MASGVIIVGASVAGVRVARELRQLDFARRIMLVERESGLPYDKPPLSKSRLSEPDACDEWLISRQELIDLEIDYLDRHHVTAVDVEAHRVRVATGTDMSFEHLVAATGSTPRRLALLDCLSGVHYVRTSRDAQALRDDLAQARRVAVIGGGFIGAEVASSARKIGLTVTIVEAAERLMSRVLPHQAARAIQTLVLEADVAVVGIGTYPATRWLAAASPPLCLGDGLRCDAHLRAVGTDCVWAAGDVAQWMNPRMGHAMRAEHWTSANEHAAVVAHNIAVPHNQIAADLVPYVWSDQHGRRIQHVGWSGAEVTERCTRRGTIFTYLQAGQVTGATGIDSPVEVMQVRRELQKDAPLRNS